jgi:hypothetical protein
MRSTFLCFCLAAQTFCAFAADLKIGMIGLDTSHVPAMTELINNGVWVEFGCGDE